MANLKGNNRGGNMLDGTDQSHNYAHLGAASRAIIRHILPSALFFTAGLVTPDYLAGSTLNFTFSASIITALVVVETVFTTPLLRNVSRLMKRDYRLDSTIENGGAEVNGPSPLSRIACCLFVAGGIVVAHADILRLCDSEYLLVLWRATLLLGIYVALIYALKYSWLFR